MMDALHKYVPSLTMTRRYLVATGWKIESSSEKYNLFTKFIDEEKCEIILAKNDLIGAWENSVSQALDAISMCSEKSLDEVCQLVSSVRRDVFRSRISDEMVRNETISLNMATDFVGSLKKMMVTTATAEIKGGAIAQRSSDQAFAYAGSCRFGHTFKGSFGFVVESPMIIDDENIEPFLPVDGFKATVVEEPFERKVIRRLASGFRQINNAVEADSTDPVLSGMASGFNANVLDALVELHDAAGRGIVKFDFAWSPELLVPVADINARLTLAKRTVEIAETASRELKNRIKPEREDVSGYVTDLHTDCDIRARDILHGDRKVIIKLKGAEYRDRRLHVPLSEKDYQKAIDAHKIGCLVSVEGKMDKIGRHWHLIDPSRFYIYEN